MKDRRLGIGLVVACVLHVLGGASVFLVRHRSTSVAPPPASPSSVELDVAVEEPESPIRSAPAEVPAAAAPAAASAAEIRPGALPAGASVQGAAIAAAEGTGATAPAPEGPSQGGEGWSFNPVARPDLAIGKTGTIGPVASTVRAPAGPKATYGLVDALDARDHAIGMTRAGPLLTATEDAVREGRGPVEGKATFLVSVDPRGVVAVTLENADKEAEAWRGLVDAIKAKAERGKPVRIPPNARGVLARIEIHAELVWPSGQQVKDTNKPSGFYAQAPAVGSAGVRPPDVGVEVHGKICSARLSVATLSIGGGCSLENIGLPAQRVVHGRIAEERRL